MNSPAVDIAGLLVTAGIGTIATDLFVSEQPSLPDECVTVFDTGGFPPEANYNYEKPTVNIRVRGKKGGYQNAYAKAKSVKDELHAKTNEDIDSVNRIIAIWCMGDIIPLGNDDNGRPMLSINFRIHRTGD